ncbi:MAG: hypothetical protein AUI14_01365 [Actinobacteria bacterium 13_2_20CM_2_71_6]|nr:MAG: hypothetical protein AUI14_01365 [Actinobacteria bacterium 13_2_20CM_2_71_6]
MGRWYDLGVRVDRRAVFAHVLLTGAPTMLGYRAEGSVRVEFATIAELRDWLAVTGLDTDEELLTWEHEGTLSDGRPYHTLYAYPRNWYGWEICAQATEYGEADLDPDTAADLTDLTDPPGAGDLG